MLVAIAGTHSPHLSLGIVWHIIHWPISDLLLGVSVQSMIDLLLDWADRFLMDLFLDGQAKRSLIVLLPDPRWLIIVRLPFWAVSSLIDLCLAMIWPSQIVQHSTISGSIIMWYEISWLLLEAFSFPFCKMHDQDSFS